ncbi:FKBP-type peptidyl-prolyl cis-trans isomerase [Thiocystis violascens]|uniref:Peptidyl-prolyl cis-trans isomerase n=1 Tax=Thiocystis violascens (strain ATCC 17096 / DSM 198 / 6111) TaxID=765911 RepID=I3YA64_THIV6|nr:peptidylprolyl isomerase [Thiocystis violascens]AFL73882.1 FKBP-type peptidyl-prolyl cis-trans isomerase [Thiocystis violascens DSM 198]
MSDAKLGDTVRIHYTGTLDDGTRFDSTVSHEPMEFTLGEGNVIPGFESAVLGMSVGESKTVTIAYDHAYGPYRAEMTQEVPRTAIPDDIELHEGLILSAESPDGIPISFVVKSFDSELVTIDGNHPLAGRDLTFALELLAIR